MTTQKWKNDPSLFNAPTEQNGLQTKKILDYDTTYRKEFLDCDPLQDWPSFDRCKWLWKWAMDLIQNDIDSKDVFQWAVLDLGTKDGCFPDWLRTNGIMAIGLEYAESYVRYAINKGRPVQYGNVCDMEFDDNSFDYVFSHHLLGLVEDNKKALEEMYRVTNKYLINLSQIPGNPKKHYSYMKDNKLFNNFITDNPCKVLYNDYLDTGYENEYVIFIKKEG